MHWYKRYVFSEIGAQETVLSLGCGVMADIDGLECRSFTGIDIYGPYIKHLKRRYCNDQTKKFLHGDVARIAWPEDSFDIIIATDILEHLSHENAIALLGKMKYWATRMAIVYTPRIFLDNTTETSDGVCDAHRAINTSPDSPYKGLGINKYQAHQCLITEDELTSAGYQIIDNPDEGTLAVWFNFERLPNPIGDLRHENRFWEIVGRSENPFEVVRGGWRREDFFARTDETVIDLFDLRLTKDDVFVDLGCGLGYICKMVAPMVKHYIGIDYSASLLDRARMINRHYFNATFIHNDGRSIPLPDKSVDCLISEQVFQHMGAGICRHYFFEIKRVLKPGGRICLQVPKKIAYKAFGFEKPDLLAFFNDDEILNIDQWYYHIVKNAKRTNVPTWMIPRI